MIVVETVKPYRAQMFQVPNSELEKGKEEFTQLLKRIAYYEIFGYNDNMIFE